MGEAESETTVEGQAGVESESGRRCDFCGKEVPRVLRVALDGEYERLQTRHQVQYACPDCSEAKERRRQDAPSG
jgi:predicted RNA-binding Zn-ribbon protein involved in translation (DUF1610 family)